MPGEDWADLVLDSGELLGQFCDAAPPDDTFGWGALYRKMWFSDYDHRPSGTGVLLTGPEGCGKHTAAAHLIRELRNRDYRVGLLPEDDDGGEGPGTPTRDRLNDLLDRCDEEGKGLCLLIEDLDRRARSRELGRFLGEMLCLYTLRRGRSSRMAGPKDRFSGRDMGSGDEPLSPFFLILIQSREQSVPSLLRSRLQLCRMSPPDRARRILFFVNHPAACLREPAAVTQEELLERTEGMSYAQLEDLVNSLNALSLADRKADKQAFLALAEAQRPPVRSGGLSAGMDRLLRELPKALSGLQIGTAVPQVAPLPDPRTEPAETPDAMRQQFEKDSVYDSSVDILGKEFVDAYISEHRMTVDRA